MGAFHAFVFDATHPVPVTLADTPASRALIYQTVEYVMEKECKAAREAVTPKAGSKRRQSVGSDDDSSGDEADAGTLAAYTELQRLQGRACALSDRASFV